VVAVGYAEDQTGGEVTKRAGEGAVATFGAVDVIGTKAGS
jgi:hypothetical protein